MQCNLYVCMHVCTIHKILEDMVCMYEAGNTHDAERNTYTYTHLHTLSIFIYIYISLSHSLSLFLSLTLTLPFSLSLSQSLSLTLSHSFFLSLSLSVSLAVCKRSLSFTERALSPYPGREECSACSPRGCVYAISILPSSNQPSPFRKAVCLCICVFYPSLAATTCALRCPFKALTHTCCHSLRIHIHNRTTAHWHTTRTCQCFMQTILPGCLGAEGLL
jgi:hypothetical protein